MTIKPLLTSAGAVLDTIPKSIYVPTLVDASNHNAQVLNARAILAGWDVPGWQVAAHAYDEPDPLVEANARVDVTRLWHRHAWYLHYFLRYLRPYGLVFYPGASPMDLAGLRWRKRLGMSAPVIGTLEGLAGDPVREAEYAAVAGHPVYCHQVPAEVVKRVDEYLNQTNHIIAISPFLAKLGKSRYGDKFSVLPLGIDSSIFFPVARPANTRMKVVSAGTFQARKRPDLFVELARRYPQADFTWYGDGAMRSALQAQGAQLGLGNLSFPGPLPPPLLGDAFRQADIFVMPSLSEGVPKVTQEAAACGLAQVIFGYYEAPSVVDGQNGVVVWDDESFFARVGELIVNPQQVRTMGQTGAEMARAWDWRVVAPKWRARLVEIANQQ